MVKFVFKWQINDDNNNKTTNYEAMIGQVSLSQSPQFPVTWAPKKFTRVEHQGVSNPAFTHPL